MKFKGTFIKALEVETFEGKDFKKQKIVLMDPSDNQPTKIVFELHKDRIALAEGLVEGMMVEADFNIVGREHNGNYYNTLKIWSLKKVILT